MLIGLSTFLISRPVGDFAFLATSLSLAVLAATSPRPRSILAAVGLAACISSALLMMNAAATLYVRGPLLSLTETGSISALNGVVYVVIVPFFVLLSATLAAVLNFLRRSQKLHS